MSGGSSGSFVKSNQEMYCVDEMGRKCAEKTGYSHHCADGLCFLYDDDFNLLLAEFKPLKDNLDSETINSIKLELKLKALETICCVLPHFIEDNIHLHEEREELKTLLMSSLKIFIFITNYRQNENPTKERLNLASDPFEIKRLKPYPFKNVISMSVDAFEAFLDEQPINC